MAVAVESFTHLLSILTDSKNREERKNLTHISSVQKDIFQNSLIPLMKSIKLQRDELEAQLSLLLSIRTIWRLVPRKLIDDHDPNYESLANNALKVEFGANFDDQIINQLSTIFRRIRSSVKNGRDNVSSLNLRKNIHSQIYKAQGCRCALCCYIFLDSDIGAHFDGDEEEAIEPYEPLQDELYLPRYYRSPTLDHIIPYFLGGDGPENWQILCNTCNTGKGDALSWILRKGWMPPSRISDVSRLTPALRFAVLSRFYTENPDQKPPPGKTLRVFYRDKNKMVLLENLEARLI